MCIEFHRLISGTGTPNRLYMYFRAESAVRFLENHNLKFSSPTLFNDPFECRIDFNQSLATTGFSAMHPDAGPLNERDIIDLQRKWLEEHKRLKIACLTTDPTNVLMWAYYAEGQRGICIEFDPSQDPLFFENLRQVKYETQLPTIGRNGSALDYSSVLVTKAIDWKHEKEWRVIRDDLEGNLFPINPQAITSVIMGCSGGHYYDDSERSNVYKNLFQLLERQEYRHIQLKCISTAMETYDLRCVNMPFFVLMEDSHTLSIISLKDQQHITILDYNGEGYIPVYQSQACKWEETMITLPNGYYCIHNDADDANMQIQVFDKQ